ncbi:AHH domain-containing protein [Bradyrhizobium jicamae]|uniref:AHH domain-containing protein n=1 Tax=Bradyrhizobium jicamae TaxID=280332 RepID=UPI001BABE281|nr:AHH domain-containing protein [Bradyrhizobium jicamae]MBR0756567.1 AHH domain-containing protein [Bradyrhizobium jicamae]
MAILADHHIISKRFKSHRAFRGIDKETFEINSAQNRIFLPKDVRLAEGMRISAHPGGHVSTYYGAIRRVLNQIAKDPDPIVRATKIETLVDAMRIGFDNGDLHTNESDGRSRLVVDQGIEQVIDNYESYVGARKDQLKAIRERKQRWLDSGQGHLIKFSAILGNADRERLLDEEIAKRPGENITSGNRDLGGTSWAAKFIAADPAGDLFTTPGRTPINPADFPSSPGLRAPSLDNLNYREGYTQSDPHWAEGPRGFPVPDPALAQLGRLPPSTATRQDPLVLKFDPATGAPLPFSERSPILEPEAPSTGTPPAGFYPAAGLAALAAVAPALSPLLLRVIGGMVSASAVPASAARGASDTGIPGRTVVSGSPHNGGIDPRAFASDTKVGGGSILGYPPAPMPIGNDPFEQRADRASTFADRFGNWPETSARTMPDRVPAEVDEPDRRSAPSVAREDVRRLVRENPPASANAFVSGTSPIPYLSSSEFNDRFGDWSATPGGPRLSQASRPVSPFAGEPTYSIPPPIWGGEHPGDPQSDAEEWFSRWIRPLLRENRVE